MVSILIIDLSIFLCLRFQLCSSPKFRLQNLGWYFGFEYKHRYYEFAAKILLIKNRYLVLKSISDRYRLSIFLIFSNNSILVRDFDLKSKPTPIFGSVRHRLITTRDLAEFDLVLKSIFDRYRLSIFLIFSNNSCILWMYVCMYGLYMYLCMYACMYIMYIIGMHMLRLFVCVVCMHACMYVCYVYVCKYACVYMLPVSWIFR